MANTELDELLEETRRRQRLKTDLSSFDGKLREMMDINISLPVILDWLERQGKKTTLPALRRYVRRTFGEEFYEAFLTRNRWLKTKQEGKPPRVPTPPARENLGRRATDRNETAVAPTATAADGNIFDTVVTQMAEIVENKDPRRNS